MKPFETNTFSPSGLNNIFVNAWFLRLLINWWKRLTYQFAVLYPLQLLNEIYSFHGYFFFFIFFLNVLIGQRFAPSSYQPPLPFISPRCTICTVILPSTSNLLAYLWYLSHNTLWVLCWMLHASLHLFVELLNNICVLKIPEFKFNEFCEPCTCNYIRYTGLVV